MGRESVKKQKETVSEKPTPSETDSASAEGGGESQKMLPGVADEVNAQIVDHLRQGKAFEEARIDAGKAEKEHKDAAQALINKYYPDGTFQAGEGDEKVVAYFEIKKKIKIRTGENAELPETPQEVPDNAPSGE